MQQGDTDEAGNNLGILVKTSQRCQHLEFRVSIYNLQERCAFTRTVKKQSEASTLFVFY